LNTSGFSAANQGSLFLSFGSLGRCRWTDIAGSSIRVAQQKTGAKLVLPLHPDLQTILATTTRKHATIMATSHGAAFTLKGFGQFVSKAITQSGLPSRCKAHGLRKAAARRLAEAGCSTKEIASITGHKSLSEIERYTRAADQEAMAESAMEVAPKPQAGIKLVAEQSEPQGGKPGSGKVANLRKNRRKPSAS
jgi:integrase